MVLQKKFKKRKKILSNQSSYEIIYFCGQNLIKCLLKYHQWTRGTTEYSFNIGSNLEASPTLPVGLD